MQRTMNTLIKWVRHIINETSGGSIILVLELDKNIIEAHQFMTIMYKVIIRYLVNVSFMFTNVGVRCHHKKLRYFEV